MEPELHRHRRSQQSSGAEPRLAACRRAYALVDMRNGIDGLRAIVESTLKKAPYDGHLFVFVGKAKDKVKILFSDRNGFVLYLKRLERGRFQLPAVDERTKHVEMEPAELANPA